MNKSTEQRYRERAKQAKRELKSVLQQSEKLTGTDYTGEPEDGDRIDVLGKRIGRSIGYIIAMLLLYHLATTYIWK